MRPELIDLFGLKFHAYPTFLAVAFIVGTLVALREAARLDDCPLLPPYTPLWMFLGAMFGARLFHIIQYGHQKLWQAFFLWQRGLVYYGGLIGGAAATAIYLALRRMPLRRAADVIAAVLPLGQAITRIGCFLNGCCYGSVTTMPWALTFPRYSHAYDEQVADGLITRAAEHSLPVHPAQLYMVGGLAIIFAVLLRALRKQPPPGRVALGYCLLYGALRFTVEGFRGDSARSFLNMTVSQMISLGLALFGSALLAWLAFRSAARKPGPQGENDA